MKCFTGGWTHADDYMGIDNADFESAQTKENTMTRIETIAMSVVAIVTALGIAVASTPVIA